MSDIDPREFGRLEAEVKARPELGRTSAERRHHLLLRGRRRCAGGLQPGLLTMLRIFLCLYVLMPSLAFGQSALPHPDPNHPGGASHIVTKNGACVWWYVYLDTFTPENQLGAEFVAYCTAVSEFPKIGGRLQTIVNSADPLKSLQTLPKRIAMSRITCPGMGRCTAEDPALAPVVAEMNAARGR